ncbi:MAG TPA: AAA family ATPase [Ramlibacter sp.]|uniref:trifunctional serine/threonine-protein kinase/ATP-binding protein/sensor histidine kinase n=1 Tax=Ramlibacter sp. TaxID=1917967 RepID=UPI002BBB194A|nr:AAA family ATPase [Ramlibacter sp.]HVZ44271.1 AAA family ATPase [Ramlibacter sp.]
MSLPSSAQPSVVIYASATTRVFRLGHPAVADSLICKEYLGQRANQRLRHEQSMLARLAGIRGVAELVPEGARGDVVLLRPCGQTSLARVLQSGSLDAAALLALAIPLTRSLVDVHRAGVVHRDINPANIVLSSAGEPVLVDFDLAILAEQNVALVRDDPIVGTLAYLAPEQTGRTGRVVDHRADLYALGATLYEMATGRPPFEGIDTLRLLHDHLVREPVSPTGIDARVPVGLSRIVLRLLAKAPEQRYQSAEGLLHDLRRLSAELESGGGGHFELGERDFAARLAPPERLVGREAELARLRAALAEAMHTPRRAVLIEGPAGVGKSALVNDLRTDMTAAGGLFAYGKYDQYQKEGATVGALTQAMRALGRLLLAQPAQQLTALRVRILDAVGANAAICTRLPEFGVLLGEQPEAPSIDPQQAELQLQLLTVDLLGAIASPERPVVMVLDDLQWAGAISLRAFERLMNDPSLRGLLLVGVHRTEEAGPAELLPAKLDQWSAQPEPPTRIALGPLTLQDLGELTSGMLRLAPQPARALAEAVNALTGGNPFDTVETLNALRREGVLSLDEAGWRWDEAKVRRFVGRGNVVDLLAARIGRLAAASRELLEYMASLGNAVECPLLAAAMGLDEEALHARLHPAVENGLLVTDSGAGQNTVRFRHDRVQQAVLAAMDDTRHRELHLSAARRLAGEAAFQAEAAQQYLACTGQLADPMEQRRAAELFHGLARTLVSRTANYLLAERYLESAGVLLAEIDDPRDAPLRRGIDAARHSALYSLGRVSESDALYAALQAHSADPLDLVEPTCLQMRSLDMRGRLEDALALGRHQLAQLGLGVPRDYASPGQEQRLDGLGEWVARESRLDFSALVPMSEPRLLGIAKLLNPMVASAYLLRDMNALTWLLLESQRLWAEHGPCADLVASMAYLTNLLAVRRQDFRTGYRVVRHVLAVGEALGFEPQTTEARYRFAAFGCAWFEPLESVFDGVMRAYQGLRSGGDISIACYSHVHVYCIFLDIAPTLDAAEAEVEAGLALCRRTGNVHVESLHLLEQRLLRALSGRTLAPHSLDDAQFSEHEFLARFGHMSYIGFWADFNHALLALLSGDAAALERHSARMQAVLKVSPASAYRTTHVHAFSAIAHAWRLREGGLDGGEAAAALAGLASGRDWLAARAADQPDNFLHLLRVVEAEEAWARGDLWQAAAAFDAAVLEARTRERPWHRAVITERAGLFYLSRGMAGAGRGLLASARDEYRAWGARGKVEQLHGNHDFLRLTDAAARATRASGSTLTASNSNSVSSEALDLMGVLRASQALSSETGLERLAARVTEVLAALSGATKVMVLSRHDGQWRLLAPASGESPIPLAQAASEGLLPLSAFDYADRTGEALVVDDASHDDRFARDPYFAGATPCSLLAAPIQGQGAVRAMVILENRAGRAAFNAQRLDAVMLIAGQLAVSLANAQLYEHLEQRVQARTRELEHMQAQLVATARRAGMAEIANNVLHNVGNVLNSLTVSVSMLRRQVEHSRIEGLGRAVPLLEQHADDLSGFVQRDPRGRTLIDYLSKLSLALQDERREALADIERLARSVEHIAYVVATQQSRSGPMIVKEVVQPEEVLEEALQVGAEAIARCGAEVVRRYGDVPAMAVDRQRLLQVLVNVIGNAAQAMETMPPDSRELTLVTALVDGEAGERLLRISVEDRGEGIAAENLGRLFAHGFSTRKNGHGFGLHSSALAAMEMGGRITARSDGPGRGAVFSLELPVAPSA